MSVPDAIRLPEAFTDLTGGTLEALDAIVSDRNLTDDASKLDGIEAGADVTDATNVAAAGALMAANNLSDVADAATARASIGAASATAPYYIEVALSGNGADIAAGTFKGLARVHTSGTITGLVIDCDPNNEPSASSIEVDLNTVNRSTGAATSVLSAVASIAIDGNTGTGTVDGTPSVSAGDLLSLDIDQGGDGKELLATIQITPS